jgi:hypothetical protein
MHVNTYLLVYDCYRCKYFVNPFRNKLTNNNNMSEEEINNLKKENEEMENAFKIQGIVFTKMSIAGADPETELMLLKEYNARLEEISKNNRPKEEPKPIVIDTCTGTETNTEPKPNVDNANDEENC